MCALARAVVVGAIVWVGVACFCAWKEGRR